mmetsp:Transcript_203/g.542  ORF Transcript_203/g.542 Transcript_203/m.542 type:complete len:210 (+) Transcript_203:51-680(+)|eukprot:CAMPEP_0114518714 /NCGR_PEP_ID=MMETSP0109-20121206/18593_1 /TAXON_ID=29199 /ORGANISM="Chlorarachnion reptans, Strain CCCM449" /LENGTH=209 /DNA_ID=CAMNT_0001699357 /DNA_START=29 /DNA_END=658 /DNA_ORIENTATION=-
MLLDVVSVLVHVVTIIFTAAALGGAEGDVAWSYYDKDSVEIRYGLLKYRVETEFRTTITAWDSSQCTADVCDDCHDTGVAVLIFLIFAFVGTTGTTLLILAKLGGFYHYPKSVILTAEFVLTVLYLIVWASWAGGCHRGLDREDEDIDVSTGFALTFLCFVFLPAVAVIQNVAFNNEGASDRGGGNTAVPQVVASSSNTKDNEKTQQVV